MPKRAFLQTPEFNFQRIGVNEGLSQGSVRDILEDNLGFLWFATADGLNRYDGYEFHTYNHHGEDPASISNGDVKNIFKDSYQNLWLTTDNSLSKYNPFYDNFQTIQSKSKLTLRPLYEDEQHVLFSVNPKGNIYSYDIRNNKEINEFLLPAALPDNENNLFFTSKDESILIVAPNLLYVFNCKEKKWYYYPLPDKLIAPTSCVVINNEFWIGLQNGEVIHYDSDFRFLEKIFIDKNGITAIGTFANSDLMIATPNGMYYYSTFRKEKKVYTSISNLVTSLSSNEINCFHYDNSGNLWVGTNNAGLNKSIFSNKKFKTLASTEYYQVKSLWRDVENGELFCGVHKKGIDIYDLVVENEPTTIKSNNNYNYIFPVADQKLLLFHPNGLDVLDRYTNIISESNKKLSDVLGTNVLSVKSACMIDDKCYVLINQSLLEISLFDFSIKNILQTNNNFDANCIYFYKNILYIGTNNGLFKIENGKTEILIKDTFIKSILFEADASFWLATTTGLFHYFPTTRTFKHFDEKYGLLNNFIYGVLKDNNGNLWCSTNRGLTRFNPQREYFRNYSLNDGIQAFEYNTGAFFKDKDGLMIFGGVGGINYFNTDMIAESPVSPRPFISKIKVNDEEYQTDTCAWLKKFLELPFEKNTISFEFVGLHYTNTERNEYQYKLEGTDKDWIYAGNRRFARYANLQPGTYTFKVKAANSDGRWNIREGSITIRITAPFWMTWWFKIMAGLVFLGFLAGLVFYYQQRKIREQQQQLAIQERVISERERISRDLHDNIGAQITYIISSMDWAKTQIPQKNQALQERFGHLRDNTQSLMSSLRDTIWTLNKKAITPTDFFDRLRQYVSYNIQRNSNLEIIFFENIENEKEIPPNIVLNLFRICQEAMQNVVKHADAKAMTISLIADENNQLKISISDDGKGFDNENRREDSFGLDNMRYRAEEINATINILSEKGKGTSVELVYLLE